MNKDLASNSYSGAYAGGSMGPNPFAEFFGDPNYGAINTAYDDKREETWTLPAAYRGQNSDYLSASIENLTYIRDSFYTKALLPIEKRSSTEPIVWSTVTFDQTLAGVVPELGVPRLIQSSEKTQKAVYQRRGLALRFEHGFMNTEKGRKHFQATLVQVAIDIAETNNFNVIHALITADRHEAYYNESMNAPTAKVFSDILERRRVNWDIIKQKKNGLEILNSDINERQRKYKGKSNTLVVPPKIQQYLNLVPKEKTDYYIAGPDGPERVKAAALNEDSQHKFAEVGSDRVYIARVFDVDPDREDLDIFKHKVQIGEMHLSRDPRRGQSHKGYKSTWQNIQVYSDDHNDFKTLSLQYLFENSNRHDPITGELYHKDDTDVSLFDTKFSDDDFAKDPFHYKDRNGNVQKADYMGHIKSKASDVLELAGVVVDQLRENFGQDLDQKIAGGLQAIEFIEQIEYSPELEAYVQALVAANPGLQSHPKLGKGFVPAVDLQEVKPNSFGGLNLPVQQAYKTALPPFYANYPGLKTIAAANNRGEEYVESLGLSKHWTQIVADFIDALDKVVGYLSKAFPKAVTINANYASSWWHKPNAATVFVENLVSKHRYPVWVAGAAEGNSLISSEFEAKNEVNKDVIDEFKTITNLSVAQIENNAGGDENKSKYTGLNAAGTAYVDAIKGYNKLKATGSIKEFAENFTAFGLAQLPLSLIRLDKDTKVNGQRVNSLAKDFIAKYINLDAGPQVIGGVSKYTSGLIQYIKQTPEAFKSTGVADRAVKKLLADINNLTKASKGSKFAVTNSRYAAGNDDYEEVTAEFTGEYTRAPLTATIALFKSTYENGGSDAFAFSSPNNPDRIINGTEYQAEYKKLAKGDRSSLLQVASSLRPTEMEVGVDASTLIASTINVINNNNRSEHAEEAQRYMGSENVAIGDEFSSFESDRYNVNNNKIIGFSNKYDSNTTRVGRKGRRSVRGTGNKVSSYQSASTPRAFSAGVYDSLANIDANLHEKLEAQNFANLFAEVEEYEQNPLIRMVAQVYLTTPTNKVNFDRLIKYDVPFPVNYLVLRPHARYESLIIIKLQAGKETGVTFMGNSHLTLGDDTLLQAYTGTYTYYARSVVTNDKNVWVEKTAFICGYEGGLGIEPYSLDEDIYNPAENRYGDGSIVVTPIEKYVTSLPNPLSVTGQFSYSNLELEDAKGNGELHFSSAPYTNQLFGFRNRELGDDFDISDVTYVGEKAQPNVICYSGHTFHYNPTTQSYTLLTKGTGHWDGAHVYPGCTDVRKGGLKEYRTINEYNAMGSI